MEEFSRCLIELKVAKEFDRRIVRCLNELRAVRNLLGELVKCIRLSWKL